MKRTLTALTVAATMFASSAYAFDPDDLQKLKDTNACIADKALLLGCDLRRAYLNDADLSLAKLEFADLSSANLSGANLRGARLLSAVLISASLEGANLEGANLFGANLGGANLRGATLDYTYMNGAILCNTTMPDGSVIYSGCWPPLNP